MIPMRKLLAIAFVLAAAARVSAQDQIRFKESAKMADMEGNIVSMSCKLVEIEILIGTNFNKQPVDAKQIADLTPSNKDKTFDFAQGENAMANNDFASASQRFQRVLGDNRATEIQKQLSLINMVRCEYYNGNPRGVIQASVALRTKKPDHFYIKEAFELEVKAHLALRDTAGAQGAINAFAQLGQQQGMPEWGKSADLMSAGLAELKKDHRSALGTYRKYARDHDVGEEATLGEMRCLTAISDWTSLNSRADSILSDAKGKKNYNPRLLIAAYNGKGESDMNGQKFKEALLNFLQGAMVLGRGEASPEHEASLGRSSVACSKLAAAEKDKTKKDTYRGRAVEMLDELKKSYPNSEYRKEAETALKEVK